MIRYLKGNDTRPNKQTRIRDKLIKWLHWDSVNKEKGVSVFLCAQLIKCILADLNYQQRAAGEMKK